MTTGTIYIDGVAYHSILSDYNEETDEYEKEEPMLDVDYDGNSTGQMIEKSACICYARSSSECCCGAWDYYDMGNEND